MSTNEEAIKQMAHVQSKLLTLLGMYLDGEGWLNTEPRDAEGKYIPWFTYPCTRFLKDIVTKDHKVFEYGSGYSSLFFTEQAGSCYSVDHDDTWVDRLKEINPNVQVKLIKDSEDASEDFEVDFTLFKSLNFHLPYSHDRAHDRYHGLTNHEFKRYAEEIKNQPRGYYDIVVVDGMARSLCGFMAEQYVNPDGYIILDNADRWQYNDLMKYLTSKGWGRIDFWGTGPLNAWGWTTSVFSRRFQITNNLVERPYKEGACI